MKEVLNSIGLKMVEVPPCTFLMGSPADEVGRSMHERQHYVTLTKTVFIGVIPVTIGQWRRVFPAESQSYGESWLESVVGGLAIENPEREVVSKLTWFDASNFCRALSGLADERKAGRKYRLPTEAEWECCCRAGSQTAYFFGETSADIDRYLGSGLSEAMTGASNPWGLYDMIGHVWEWCSDWLAPFDSVPCRDPKGEVNGIRRVMRGGGYSGVYNRSLVNYRSAARFGSLPYLNWSEFYDDCRGVRVVMEEDR